MRRDLNRGCATCRLRFSALLSNCPVCNAAASSVPDATSQIQPTSRAAWLAKWAFALALIPASVLVLRAMGPLFREGWPPKNALDAVMFVYGNMGVGMGFALVISIPLVLWLGLLAIVRFILKHLVDRPRRTLRVTIEREARPAVARSTHLIHRLWDKLVSFIERLIDSPKRPIIVVLVLYFGAQALADILSDKPTVKFSSLKAFGESMFVIVFTNAMGILLLPLFGGVFGGLLTAVLSFFTKPPTLFGYNATPPPLQNEACLESFMQGRQEIIGHAAALDEAERAALGAETIHEVRAPLSGQTCLAFRIVGETDDQPVDDADAASFAVVTQDQKRCVVTNADVVVSLAASTKVRAENAGGFLGERGLPEKDISAREGVLREGDLVRVFGRRTEIRVGSAGYRGDERRMMLDAGDGKPVVLGVSKDRDDL